MNERIFELAKQADLIHWDTLPSGARTPDHESVVKARKFAELILSECIQYLNNEVDRLHKYRDSLPSWDENMKCECDLIIEKCMDNVQGLKEHFGIDPTK